MTTAPALPRTQAHRPANDGFKALQDLDREHGFEPLEVDGRIPSELRGTIYRNGATLFSAGGTRYAHWFDGDGGLAAVRFEGGTARGAVRVIVSEQLREERAAGKMLYGGFGTPQPGLLNRLRGKFKHSANTSVMWWNQRLLALMEAHCPNEIDPDTLETLGETDLGGVIPQAFSAHPHAVPSRNAIYNFGVRYGKQTMLDLFELPVGGSKARTIASLPLPGPTIIHDFIASENHLIFFVPPVRMRILRMFLGMGGPAQNLAWRPELGTEVLVVPIDDPTHPVRFTARPFYQWHYANAFERGSEIVVDFVRYPDFESNRALTELFQGTYADRDAGDTAGLDGRLYRTTIDLETRNLREEEVWDRGCEFTRVAPAAEATGYRYCYAAAHSPGSETMAFQDTIARIDMESGDVREHTFPAGHYASEPVFVPRPDGASEDDGWLLALVYDADSHTSYSAILDARDPDAGPLATARFDHHIPPRFHGIWVGR